MLTPFTVTGEQVGRYQSNQAASCGRMAVSLLDAQSIRGRARESDQCRGPDHLIVLICAPSNP